MNYHLTESEIHDYDIKLDANENPYPHSEKVLKGLEHVLENSELVGRYPHKITAKLCDRIADNLGVDSDMILVGTGSKELIEVVYKVFLDPGDIVLLPNPSLSAYNTSATLCHARVIKYELNRSFNYDYKSILEYVKVYSPKVLMIGNPNNPTGTVMELEMIENLLDKVDCPVIIDETYGEFYDISAVDLVKKHKNLIISKTFAKAYGLAGLKIGYLIANTEMIKLLKIGLQSYEVSSFAQHMALLVYDDLDYYKQNIKRINRIRDAFAENLKTYSFVSKVYDSVCNFVLVEYSDARVLEYLLENKVLLRTYGDDHRLKNHLRFTIGTEEEMKRLEEILDGFEAWSKN